MLAIKIWNYLKGYVIIRIKGLSLERLLNLALANDIYLWNVNRISNTEIEATISVKGYKSLEKIVNKVGCRVDINHRAGLPFTFEKLKKRKMLGIGAIIFISLIALLSSIVWEIEIIGAEQIPMAEINEVLDKNNITIGKFKKNLDMDIVEGLILKEFEHISFLDIRITGVKLIVELKEQDIPPEKIDKSYPSHLVAKKRGVVNKVIARQGKALVEKGKIVEKGDILISGYMEGVNPENSYLVHAEGEVLAQTRYMAVVEEPIITKEEVETGRIYKQRALKFGDKGIRFLSGDIPYDEYIEEVSEKSIIKLKWPKLNIPIKIVQHKFIEVESKEVKHDIDFLKQSTQLKAIEEINQQLPKDVEIISKDAVYTIEDNILKTQIIIETIEDITKVQMISN